MEKFMTKLAEIHICEGDKLFYIRFEDINVFLPITKVEELRVIIPVEKARIGYLITIKDARMQTSGKYNSNSYVIIEKPKSKKASAKKPAGKKSRSKK